ncbi:hypothetical protein [Cupriavidus pauculus]|uniref:hypothetical protein n=1 Tax=Cupriavidus pauculus TaxID=82633 RepID=UPI0038572401
MKTFLAATPYRDEGFRWGKHPPPDTPGWTDLQIIVELPLQKRIKAEANRTEVALSIILLTAVMWWLHRDDRRPVRKRPKGG